MMKYSVALRTLQLLLQNSALNRQVKTVTKHAKLLIFDVFLGNWACSEMVQFPKIKED